MNMTLSDATALAARIHADQAYVVIAIGRFKLTEELTAADSDQMPWGISIMPRDNPTGRATIWSLEQWDEYRTVEADRLRLAKRDRFYLAPSKKVAPAYLQPAASSPQSVPVTPTEDQLLLF